MTEIKADQQELKLKPPRIEKIVLSPEDQKNLDRIQSSRDLREHSKNSSIRRIRGYCCVCDNLPEMKLIIDLGDASRIEKYCKNCWDKEKEKVRIYDKLPTN